jgi:hypothetical protein
MLQQASHEALHLDRIVSKVLEYLTIHDRLRIETSTIFQEQVVDDAMRNTNTS